MLLKSARPDNLVYHFPSLSQVKIHDCKDIPYKAFMVTWCSSFTPFTYLEVLASAWDVPLVQEELGGRIQDKIPHFS